MRATAWRWIAAGCAAAAATGGAAAQEASAAGLAATCSACHAPDAAAVNAIAGAASPGSPMVPALAGMPASRLAAQMRDFKSGARPSTVMQQLAKGYSDAQIDRLAAYFAALPKAGP